MSFAYPSLGSSEPKTQLKNFSVDIIGQAIRTSEGVFIVHAGSNYRFRLGNNSQYKMLVGIEVDGVKVSSSSLPPQSHLVTLIYQMGEYAPVTQIKITSRSSEFNIEDSWGDIRSNGVVNSNALAAGLSGHRGFTQDFRGTHYTPTCVEGYNQTNFDIRDAFKPMRLSGSSPNLPGVEQVVFTFQHPTVGLANPNLVQQRPTVKPAQVPFEPAQSTMTKYTLDLSRITPNETRRTWGSIDPSSRHHPFETPFAN